MTFDGVSFCYPNEPQFLVVNHISLTLEHARRTSLAGASMSGSTAVIDLLFRFYEPDQGNIVSILAT